MYTYEKPFIIILHTKMLNSEPDDIIICQQKAMK